MVMLHPILSGKYVSFLICRKAGVSVHHRPARLLPGVDAAGNVRGIR
jgi:hypothetical protein